MIEYLKVNRRKTVVTVLFILIETALQTVSARILANLLDAAVAQNVSETIHLFALNVIIFCLFLLFKYCAKQLRTRTIQAMVKQYRNIICKQIAAKAPQHFAAETEGAFVSCLTNDAKIVEINAFDTLFTIIESISVVFFSAVALVSFHPLLMVVTLVFSALILLIPNLHSIRYALQASQELLSTANRQYTGTISDLLAGYIDLFQQDRQALFLSTAKNASETFETAAVTSGCTGNKIETCITLINIVSQMAVTFVTVLLVLVGRVSAGALLSVGQLSGNIFNDLDTISNAITKIQSVYGLLHPIHQVSNTALKEGPDIPVPIIMRQVNYIYDSHPVFKHAVDFVIEPGKKYAIVGRSGSGKSTLVNILCGNYRDYEGSICIGGTELRDMSYRWLHSHLILMRQTPHLFNFSIEDNIFLGANHSQEDLNRLLDSCALTEVVNALPQGAATLIGQGKVQLSGGQQQRVLLARILASGCRFVILDEGTSSQDKENSFAIESKLLHSPNLTLLIITHHMNSNLVNEFDGILEL